jgi:hypothetical protein
MARRSTAMPRAATAATAATTASGNATPAWYAAMAVSAPIIAKSPCAKFTMRVTL